MPRRLQATMFDYMVVAINPALIMVLVGSLIYFLLEMFYQGQYPERLHYCLTLFVFAAVLIARISMEEGWEHAAPFGAALALTICLAMHRFVSYEGTSFAAVGWLINYALIGLSWWCATKLTWDCTLIDECQDASGEGLLQTVGLDPASSEDDKSKSASRTAGPSNNPAAGPSSEKNPSQSTARPFDDELGWSVRNTSAASGKSWWQRFVERRRRPHAPGVWVVYFSLAALPIFGVGQAFIPADNTTSRHYAFVLLCVYVASGLGLLLTTSFLGLRRYLRQRRLEMPLPMAGTWLATGAVLILALLFVTALLPRPNAEYALSELPFAAKSEEHDSSKLALGKEGTKDEQAESRTGAPRKSDNPESKPTDTQAGTHSADKNPSDNQSNKSSNPQGNSESNERGTPGGSGRSNDTKGGSNRGETKGGEAKQSNSQENSQSEQSSQKPPSEQNSQAPNQQSPDSSGASASDTSEPINIGPWFADLLKWVFYGAVVLIAASWAVRHWKELGQWIRDLIRGWREFWANLFGGKRRAREAPPVAEYQKSFLEFTDPFAAGVAGQYSPEELVRYSFEAFEAWGRDHGCPRDVDQTAFEFARKVGSQVEPLAQPARRLAELYSSAAYSQGTLPQAAVDHLRLFWEALTDRRAVVVGPSQLT